MDYNNLSIKSIFFFIILFGIIIYAYLYYDTLFLSYPFLNIVKILTIVLAILSVTFPLVMDYFNNEIFLYKTLFQKFFKNNWNFWTRYKKRK